MPKVLNIRTPEAKKGLADGTAVRVDRKTKWGNPYIVGKNVPNRNIAVDSYAEYLHYQDHLVNSLHELRGKDLVCHCAPRRCHADVLLREANG